MTRKTFTLSLISLTIGASLGLFSAPGMSVPTSERSNLSIEIAGNEWNAFTPPDGLGTPGRREGGGTRGDCPAGVARNALTALVPETTAGATILDRPEFLFYLPASSGVLEVEFVLLDDLDNAVYTKTLTAPSQAGIVTIDLKEDSAPALEVGQSYHWYFSAICNPNDRSADIHVEGWIERVDAEQTEVKTDATTSASEKVTIYTEASIWYDAIAVLAEQRRSYPNDANLEAQWQQMLASVGLDEIADIPLIEWSNDKRMASKRRK
ncbi:MAG: DUF928 domain-containing protein [Cyanobacteriota bacterium]|nr:DUF928 domain-containing protein [Cyanobacteriota bacterium]